MRRSAVQRGAGTHGHERVEALASGLDGVVAARGAFLVTVFGWHGRVPVEDEPLGQGAPERGRGLRDPRGAGGFVDRGEEAFDRVVADHALQAEQLGHGRILAQAFDVREAPSVHQRGQEEAVQDIVHGFGVGAGALDRAGGRQPFDDAGVAR